VSGSLECQACGTRYTFTGKGVLARL
jgi:hypothetical protein